MAEGTLVVSIHPPAGMSSDEFLQEIKNEVFPAVNKGPTRVGVIESWSLLQRVDNTGALEANAAYIWLINWNGFSGTAELVDQALEKLRAKGASVHETNYESVDGASAP